MEDSCLTFQPLPACRPCTAPAPRPHPDRACPRHPASLYRAHSDPAPVHLSLGSNESHVASPLARRPLSACAPSLSHAIISLDPAHASLPAHATLALPAACSPGPQIRNIWSHVYFGRCPFPACSPPLLRAFISPVLAPATLSAYATLVLPAACSFGPHLQGP